MRFNHKAFFFGFLGLLILNAFFAYIIWYIAENFIVQFQETSFFVKILLYVPSLIVNVVWIICAVRTFDNGPKPKIISKIQSNALATPENKNSDGFIDNFSFERHKTKLFFIVGSVGAILASLLMHYYTVDIYTIINKNGIAVNPTIPTDGGMAYTYQLETKRDVRIKATATFKIFSDKMKNHLSSNSNIKQLQTNVNQLNKWQNIFTSNLGCFSEEKKLYDKGKKGELTVYDFRRSSLLIEENNSNDKYSSTMNIFSNFGIPKNGQKTDLVVDYEYWIDPEDNKHFKLRYHKKTFEYYFFTSKSTTLPIIGVSYNPIKKCFMQDRASEFLQKDYGYFVYDSEKDEYQFEYDGFWENFFEHQKWIFYTVWYLFSFGICILIIKIMRKLALSNFFKGKHYPKTIGN